MLGGVIKTTLAAFCLLAGAGCASFDLGWRNSASPEARVPEAGLSSEGSDVPAAPVSLNGPKVMDTALTGSQEKLSTPKLYLREIEINRVPDASQQTTELAAVKPKLEVRQNDLWADLRAGFRLSNLEEQPERVAHFESWYAKHPKYFKRLAERAYWFLPYVLAEVEARNIPAEVAILPAVESAFRPDATSRSRAAGMWQFISATGRRFGLRQDWWMDARRDLVQSTRAALDYLDYLSQEFNGDWELALAAYNAGEGTIRKQLRRNKAKGLPLTYSALTLRRETSEYVPRLFAIRNILKDPGKFNITLTPLDNVQRLQVVDLKTQTDLTVVASMISLNRKQLHFLNLGYVRGVTPPNGPHTIVVPSQDAEKLMRDLAGLSARDRMQWARHRVKKGEYLGKIAKLHGVDAESIRTANSIKGNLIKPGQELRIPLSGGAKYAGSTTVTEKTQTDKKKHMVSKGDTLWNISRKYHVSLNSLMRWNQLSRKSILQPGQTLVVFQ
ncbi:MAG: LysM peptidoglycan-binding domain-containing protein [Acidiferrobacterales bacterium]|nr:LysM peptidoglycan-binding domain-containing protein [Acidiferrobacterales bacterium]